ncbi:hypothetical protein LINPERHAP2_LOCUS23826 [Linum perenne]
MAAAASSSSNSRSRYAYTVFELEAETHPKMGSSLIPWQLLGAFTAGYTLVSIFAVTKLETKIGETACTFIPLALAFVYFYIFMIWCFPPVLPLLGSTRKFILDMIALQAAFFCSYHLTNHDKVDIFLLLISSTTLAYVHIKHAFVVYDLNLRDVFFVVALQSLIYWMPYGVAISCYVLFVCFKFCTCGKNSDQSLVDDVASKVEDPEKQIEAKKEKDDESTLVNIAIVSVKEDHIEVKEKDDESTRVNIEIVSEKEDHQVV